MEHIIVSSLKLGFLGIFVFLIGIVIGWTFKRSGFYKRDWILNGVFSFMVTILGLVFFIFLNLSRNSYQVLRGNFISWIYFVLGVFIFCGLVVLLRNIFRKKKIVFLSPIFKSVTEKDQEKIIKHAGELQRKKYKVYYYTMESWVNKRCDSDALNNWVNCIFSADEIHIWHADNYDEIWFVLGVYFSHRLLFGHKKIVVLNDGYSLLYGGNNPIRKILFELERCS
jgi:hypothetical protein